MQTRTLAHTLHTGKHVRTHVCLTLSRFSLSTLYEPTNEAFYPYSNMYSRFADERTKCDTKAYYDDDDDNLEEDDDDVGVISSDELGYSG